MVVVVEEIRRGHRRVTEVGGRRDDCHRGAGIGFDVSVGVGVSVVVIVHGGNGGRWWLVRLGLGRRVSVIRRLRT